MKKTKIERENEQEKSIKDLIKVLRNKYYSHILFKGFIKSLPKKISEEELFYVIKEIIKMIKDELKREEHIKKNGKKIFEKFLSEG